VHLFYLTEPAEVRLGYSQARKYFWATVAGPGGEPPPSPHADGSPELRLSLRAAEGSRVDAAALYAATHFEAVTLGNALGQAGRGQTFRLLADAAARQVAGTPPMPPLLGGDGCAPLDKALAMLSPKPGAPMRVAVINVYHAGYGDAIVSCTLLRQFRARLAERFGAVVMHLFQPTAITSTDSLYTGAGGVDDIHPLPAPLSLLAEYDAVVDLSAPRAGEDAPWIDVLLKGLGMDPAQVPPEAKRNRVPLDPTAVRDVAPAIAAARAAGEPVLLMHPLASTAIRSFPIDAVERLLNEVMERTRWTVAGATPIPFRHPRYMDWSPHSRSFEHFSALVAQADAFVSADTSLYHVADAFSVPGVVVFTSILPEWRIPYYPFVEGIALRRDNRLLGMHFSHDADDMAYARSLWEALETGQILDALRHATERRGTAAALFPNA
jgi:hypothetical protein